MDINEPITLENERMYCEEGNKLALEFLLESRRAVVECSRSPSLVQMVTSRLQALMRHTSACPHCNED
jgi:hypothetical protein